MESKALLTRQDHILHACLYVLLVLFLVICAYPVYFVLVASVSSPTAANSGQLLLFPKDLQLEGYRFVLSDSRITIGYMNTVIYTVFGTLTGLAASLLAGYSLSRKDLPFRNLIMAVFVFTMYFSGGLVPIYMVVKWVGLVNTRFAIIILGSVSVYNIILIRTFFSSTIPTELQEAAFIDGCSNTRFFLQFVLPLSTAIISVIALYLAVGYWNSYFTALIYLSDRNKHPLQLFLRDILLVQTSGEMMDENLNSERKKMVQVIKYAVIVVSTFPIMCLYPFLQKYFIKGVMIGSLKG